MRSAPPRSSKHRSPQPPEAEEKTAREPEGVYDFTAAADTAPRPASFPELTGSGNPEAHDYAAGLPEEVLVRLDDLAALGSEPAVPQVTGTRKTAPPEVPPKREWTAKRRADGRVTLRPNTAGMIADEYDVLQLIEDGAPVLEIVVRHNRYWADLARSRGDLVTAALHEEAIRVLERGGK